MDGRPIGDLATDPLDRRPWLRYRFLGDLGPAPRRRRLHGRLYHLEITADGVRSHNAIITRPGFAAKLQRYRENDARASEANPGERTCGRAIDRGATEYYPGARESLVAVKSSISLTDEQHAFARALVDAGRYASLSAVLQQGVDLLRQRMDAQELEHAALRELLFRRRQGEFVSGQRMDTRLARMIADKRRAHGLQS